MSLINQNKALKSLSMALENQVNLIDSRSEIDDLNFLVNFSSLINFYDDKNQVNGSWTPFLLKDPSFLMASIAKTPFKKMYTLFLQTSVTLKRVLEQKELEKNEIKEKVLIGFKQLFHQLLHVFHLIERWIYYMLQYPLEYKLKSYVIREVKTKYSHFLWAILWLKNQLHHNKIVEKTEDDNDNIYQSYDKNIWKSGVKTTPYWELLEINYSIENTNKGLLNISGTLKKIGEIMFSFFNSIIEYAPVEFQELEKEKDLYPDTLLLKTFTELIKPYKNQLNGLTKKHLNFYYKDILKERKTLAKPDSVFVCAELQENVSTFDLAKGTLFNGGTYQDDSTILYESVENVSINPAKIAEVYTLSKVSNEKKESFKLYLKTHENVNEVKTSEEGEIQSWKTFGSSTIKDGKKVNLGFAFASPMLFLNGGKRKLCITITFKEDILNLEFFTKGIYQLSTEEEWFIILDSQIKITQNQEELSQLFIEIQLTEEDPAIIAFSEEKDNFKTSWPLFYMSFSEFMAEDYQLEIKTITIDVEVKNLQNFQLYNDFGALETEKPFQLLGPTPSKDQSFMIGSSEVFSKPVTEFDFKLNWDNLPDNFIKYYEQYNKYLADFYKNPPIKDTNFVFQDLWNKTIGNLFKNNKKIIKKALADIDKAIESWFLKDGKLVNVLISKIDKNLNKIFSRNKKKSVFVLKQTEKKINVFVSGSDQNVKELRSKIKELILNTLVEVNIYKEPFNDKAFKVDFQLLQNKQWTAVDMNFTPSILKDIFQLKSNDLTRTLFQGTPLFIDEKFKELKISELIKINRNITVDTLFILENIFTTDINFQFKNGIRLEDQIKVKNVLKIINDLEVSAILRIKEEVTLDKVLKEENSIKLTDVFEIKENLKAREVFVFQEFLEVNDTFSFEKKLKKIGVLKNETTTIEHIKFHIEKLRIINRSLSFNTIIELDDSLFLKDFLDGKTTTIFKINKEFKFKELFHEADFNFTEVLTKSVESIKIECKNESPIILNSTGTLSFKETVEIFSFLKIQDTLKFTNIFQTKGKEIYELKENTTTYKEMFNYSVFGSTKITEVQKDINPEIQYLPLEFDETSTSGFLRMKLTNPIYGFGAILYPKVVSAIAMYNADLLSLAFNKQDVTFQEEANEPYTPIVGIFTGNYKSSFTYDFTETDKKNKYPIQCFYQDVFKNYKVYDSSLSTITNKKINVNFPSLLPRIKQEGTLFLGLQEVIAPAELSIYFQLVQDYATTYTQGKSEISYRYLSENYWKKLPVLADGTNGFSCSGLIVLNLLSESEKLHHTMPSDNLWISISVDNNTDSFCKTSFLNTNGFKLKRTGKNFRFDTEKPEIAANTIDSPYSSIPQIATIMQPFSSFGGQMAETDRGFNKRVSVRLKTKDRVISNEDYYRIIKETFVEVFYPKIIFNRALNKTEVLLVKNIQDWTESNAFIPLVNTCLINEVQEYLKGRASKFANIQVRNFDIRYLKIEGEITVTNSYAVEGVSKEINRRLNIFLSPWITTTQSQITIDSGISIAQISEFITSYPSIKSVQNLKLYLGEREEKGKINYTKGPFQIIETKTVRGELQVDFELITKKYTINSNVLIVPSLNNQELIYVK
ncbi:hypothetical protein ACSIGC_03745 [Tenacibaculum sp. ZS6-P6]|uniref:hypothetical protein n=1 Tax=Tenacibaculum sp. ZS6-P6 TaxID=3447503 RepID=UPI003F9DCB3B